MKLYVILCVGFSFFAGRSLAQQHSEGIRFNACVGRATPPADFYQGKFLVLDFWATWCGPCIGSMPHLKEIATHYAQDSRVVFATITREPEAKVTTMLARRTTWYLTDYPLIDTTGSTSAYYGINSIPRALIFNDKGALVFNGHTQQLSVSLLDSLLEGKTYIPSEPPLTQSSSARPDWGKVAAVSDYLVRFGASDTLADYGSSELSFLDEAFWLYGENQQLSDYLEQLTGYSVYRMVATQPDLLKRRMDCCIKIPLKADCQQQALALFAARFQFQTQEIWQKKDVCEFSCVHPDSLRKYISLSAFGKVQSWHGEQAELIGYTLADLVVFLESNGFRELPVMCSEEMSAERYDFTLDCTDIRTLSHSLQQYGIQVSDPVRKRIRVLKIDFDV